MTMRNNRAKAILMECIAQYIAREAGRNTLITLTDAEVSPDRKNATIFITVFPDNQGEHALNFLKRHRDSLHEHLKKTSRLNHLPRLTFQIDFGEKTRQHLDEITRHLPKIQPEATEERE
jgi:ribosome-binding factor A